MTSAEVGLQLLLLRFSLFSEISNIVLMPMRTSIVFVGRISFWLIEPLLRNEIWLRVDFKFGRSDLFKVKTRVQTSLKLDWLKFGLGLAFVGLIVLILLMLLT